jgi:hypothetical protein
MLNSAKRLIRNQGLALRNNRVEINHIGRCGCCYDLYDTLTKTGLIVDGGKTCKIDGNHGVVYQPSINLVMNDTAIQMFKLYAGIKDAE